MYGTLLPLELCHSELISHLVNSILYPGRRLILCLPSAVEVETFRGETTRLLQNEERRRWFLKFIQDRYPNTLDVFGFRISICVQLFKTLTSSIGHPLRDTCFLLSNCTYFVCNICKNRKKYFFNLSYRLYFLYFWLYRLFWYLIKVFLLS